MINETRIQQNVEAFSFPRLFGSDGERKAYDIAKNKIEDLNLTAYSQKFSFTNFYSIFYSRIMLTLASWLLLVLYLNIGGIFQNVNLIIILILFVLLIIISRKPENIKIGKELHSQNVYAKINSNSDKDRLNNNKKEIIFLAHLDSKGNRFDITGRVRTFILYAYSLIISFVFIIYKNIVFTQIPILLYLFGAITLGLNLFSVILLYLNKVVNHSNGALDNASGVACVFELLNYYSNPEMRLNKSNLWFLFTGAEECGTIGIRNFYRIIKDLNIDKNQMIVINFDSIGTNVDLIKFGLTTHNSFKDQHIFLKNAENLNLSITTRNVPFGVHTDGYYLFKKGYPGLEFGDWRSYRYLHSINDTIDKVDASLLTKVCQIVTDSLNEIDKFN